MTRGIGSAVNMVESYGRGPDTMLAHISPDEAQFIDYLQGGRRVNPTTGLAEYGLFGKIIKGVVRAAAGIGGFMVGGPAGAAAASAAATKLTGGSWKNALTSGALAGIGGGLGNMASGTGFMGTTGLAGAAANSVPLSQLGNVASQTVLPTGIAATVGSAAAGIGGLGGLGAGAGALMGGPREQAVPGMQPQAPLDPGITYNPNQPVTREYVPFQGDYSKYGEGGEHNFYRRLSVPGVAMARGGRASAAARRGRVDGPGTETSDDVPAMLSNHEHVLDAEVVRLKGNGSVERGHEVIEKEKRALRKKAGIPAPYRAAADRARRSAGAR